MRREHTFIPMCRVPHCKREAKSRGLCLSCYQAAYQLVIAGSVTWKELERRGKVNEVRTVKGWLLD